MAEEKLYAANVPHEVKQKADGTGHYILMPNGLVIEFNSSKPVLAKVRRRKGIKFESRP